MNIDITKYFFAETKDRTYVKYNNSIQPCKVISVTITSTPKDKKTTMYEVKLNCGYHIVVSKRKLLYEKDLSELQRILYS